MTRSASVRMMCIRKSRLARHEVLGCTSASTAALIAARVAGRFFGRRGAAQSGGFGAGAAHRDRRGYGIGQPDARNDRPVKPDGRRAADGGDVHGFAHGVFVVRRAPAQPVFRPELHGKEHFIPLEGDPAGPGMEAEGGDGPFSLRSSDIEVAVQCEDGCAGVRRDGPVAEVAADGAHVAESAARRRWRRIPRAWGCIRG